MKAPRRHTQQDAWCATLRRAVVPWCLPVAFGATIAGCAHAQAKTQPELPPLEMPAPPPRVVEANEPTQAPQIALPQGPATNIRPPAQPPAQRTDAPRQPEPPKTD